MQTRLVLDKIPVGIIIFNEMKQVEFINRMGKEVLEKTQGYLVETLKELVLKTFKTSVSVQKVIQYSNKDNFYIFKAQTDLLEGQVMIIIQDATNNYQLTQTVLKAEKLAVIGQLAVGSLVELRNPLTSARGFCQLIENQRQAPQEYIDIISKELEQIQIIINNCSSMVQTAKTSNFDTIYKQILLNIHNHINHFNLIMVSDDDNLVFNISDEYVKSILINLTNLINLWIEENAFISISTDLADETGYVILNIRAHCDSKWNAYEPIDFESTSKWPGDQVELRFIDNSTVNLNMRLPVITPQYAKSNFRNFN